MDNIISIKTGIIERVRKRRKELHISQMELAERTGVSLGSIKRFETKGELALTALIKIAFALGYESDFNQLFVRRSYTSLEDVINEKK